MLPQSEIERRQRFYEEMTPDMKVEFIGGEVVLHSPARNVHLVVTSRLSTLLNAWLYTHKIGAVLTEKCLCVFPRNDYEPDIVFFGPEKAAGLDPQMLKFPVPDFIAEVLSESTERNDRGIKYRDYEANGVREYWIVDAESEIVEQYVLRDGRFELKLKACDGHIESMVATGFRIPIRAIFDHDECHEALQTFRRVP